MGTPDIQEEKKNELIEVVTSYQEIPFENSADSVFSRQNFNKYIIPFGGLKIGDTYKLNLSKLRATYNRALSERVEKIYDKVQVTHCEMFRNWCESLIERITCHIQEYNPILRKLVDEIRKDTEKIADLQDRQTRLAEYVDQIENLMSWKNR